MATKKPDRFDQVDWTNEDQSGRFDLSINTKIVLLGAIPLALLGLYEWQFVPDRAATFEQLGEHLGLLSLFETIGLTYDATLLEYLFIFTIVLFIAFAVVPLYQNPRMTRVYWNEFKQNRPAVLSLVWLGIVFVGGIIGPFFISPPSTEVLHSYQPPLGLSIDTANVPECAGPSGGGECFGSTQYLFGTDGSGRSIGAIIVHGMTISMQIAFITTSIVAAFGITVGTVSAFSGGWVDEVLMRFTDIILSFPTFIMFLLILYIYGGGLGMFILVFSLFAWGGMARYVRSKALSVSEEEFVKATKISGASRFRLVRKHVVPNTASSIITQLTLSVPGFLLFEAQLAFLGLGDPTLPSWGQLIATGRDSLSYAPWITIIPGFVLFLTILAFNFVGDAILDAINPEADSESE